MAIKVSEGLAEALGSMSCWHRDIEPRRRTDSLGRVSVQNQCLACGTAIGSALKQSSYQLGELKPFDSDLQEQVETRWRENAKSAKAEQSMEWWARYNEYLRSPEWREKRQRVLDRDGGVCQSCLSSRATQVHHRSYANVGDEPLFELVSVCEPCHDKITATSRRLAS